ncbi:hypothetical protein Dvina_15435 [Dactylosporangium vinaceum]|uniref:Uncharacterized protein n=1 Tax=Dactylosporangium vinaceum TaxID=53362 RepID=A0ABV5M220_9ACTN|nr:hypothetical protein [Dactylosporangium vinaceum]UAB99344.1 hypothetical protein Dvina_15435 [Dactylosporangium vinaceum]
MNRMRFAGGRAAKAPTLALDTGSGAGEWVAEVASLDTGSGAGERVAKVAGVAV